MHEIEVKAGLKDKESFIKELSQRGCELGPERAQDDTVFVREIGSIDTYLDNPDFLRLREESGQTFFTLKNHPDRGRSGFSAPFELELAVSSREIMQKMLIHMGYQEAIRIKKTRRKGKYKNWEVCIDEVEGLGCFVELEELTGKPDAVEQIQGRMKSFLAEFGLTTGDQSLFRYDILLLQEKLRNGEVA